MSVFFMCNLLLTCSDPLKSTLTSEMLKQFYEMESNIVWKNHLQFFKYFVCQEMKILIILWKHSYDSKKWFKNNDFVLSWSPSQLNVYSLVHSDTHLVTSMYFMYSYKQNTINSNTSSKESVSKKYISTTYLFHLQSEGRKSPKNFI